MSASTLRRFWGYVSEGVSPSKFTKDVLAKFLGYTDFEQFGLSQGMGEQQSQMVIGWEISENTRVSKDDTFECHHFINHEPAYLHAWKHGDMPSVTYAIGKKDGIIVERYLED